MAFMRENILYHNRNILVTKYRVRFGKRAYDIEELKSAELIQPVMHPAYGLATILSGVLVGLFGTFGRRPVAMPVITGSLITTVGAAALAFATDNYLVRLEKHNGEVMLMPVDNQRTAQQIVYATREAISGWNRSQLAAAA